MFTATVLLFGETAPSVIEPNAFPNTACALGDSSAIWAVVVASAARADALCMNKVKPDDGDSRTRLSVLKNWTMFQKPG
ncbi:MAG: hypothetical protein M0R77_20450 [Gammaproteobacteria bacterium]|nr:hypothetical protein [Gammaproteobacteria bacterium]